MAYDDLKEHGSETAVKAAGKLRQQGKPYESELLFLSMFKALFIRHHFQWLMEILRTGSLGHKQ
jgi:hypothetical protein